jgi:hypothetical protein
MGSGRAVSEYIGTIPGPHCPNCDCTTWKVPSSDGPNICDNCGWKDGDPQQLPQPQDLRPARNRVEELTFAILASPHMDRVINYTIGARGIINEAIALDILLTEHERIS